MLWYEKSFAILCRLAVVHCMWWVVCETAGINNPCGCTTYITQFEVASTSCISCFLQRPFRRTHWNFGKVWNIQEPRLIGDGLAAARSVARMVQWSWFRILLNRPHRWEFSAHSGSGISGPSYDMNVLLHFYLSFCGSHFVNWEDPYSCQSSTMFVYVSWNWGHPSPCNMSLGNTCIQRCRTLATYATWRLSFGFGDYATYPELSRALSAS